MAEITKEMVLCGIRNGVVDFIPCPGGDGDHEPVAKIGDKWFYFAGSEGENMTVGEYLDSTPKDDVIREIINAVEGLSEEERGYYRAILEEEMTKTTYLVPVSYTMYGRVEVRGNFSGPEDALKWVDEHIDDIPLPYDASYLDDSFKVDREGGIVLDENGNVVWP